MKKNLTLILGAGLILFGIVGIASASEPLSVPEPATLLFLGSGFTGIIIFGWRKFKK